jgi:hypothetical protein
VLPGTERDLRPAGRRARDFTRNGGLVASRGEGAASGPGREGEPEDGREPLTAEETRAVHRFIGRVRREVPARLVQASLFGSKARGQARPDSDVDVLLIFHWLPPDREPQASHAEDLADEAARESGVPLTAWSVSLVDLEHGNRTPMLVDALEDSVPLWWERRPLRPLPFTPDDALRCAGALLTRVSEGSEEFAWLLGRGDLEAASRRARDDVVRLCTARLLLRGVTRPRRGEAVTRYLEAVGEEGLPEAHRRVLRWAAGAFGPGGRDEEAVVPTPPGGLAAAARSIDALRAEVARAARALEARPRSPGT